MCDQPTPWAWDIPIKIYFKYNKQILKISINQLYKQRWFYNYKLQIRRSYFSELIKVGFPGTVSLETNIPLYLEFFISILRHGESDKKK